MINTKEFKEISRKEIMSINGGGVAGAVAGAVFGFGVGLCVNAVKEVVVSQITGRDVSAANIFGGAGIYALKATVAGAVSPI